MKLREEAAADYRSAGSLIDTNGQVLANIHVNLSPGRGSGEFRLPKSADPNLILGATVLQIADGRRFQVVDLKQVPGYHTIGPDLPIFEFHFQEA